MVLIAVGAVAVLEFDNPFWFTGSGHYARDNSIVPYPAVFGLELSADVLVMGRIGFFSRSHVGSIVTEFFRAEQRVYCAEVESPHEFEDILSVFGGWSHDPFAG